MNIKQSIASLIILLGVLFSAFSVSAAQPTYKVSDVSAYPDCKLLLGMRVNPASYVSCYENKFVNYKDFSTKSCYLRHGKYVVDIMCHTTSASWPLYRAAGFFQNSAQCPPDYEKVEDGYVVSCEPIVPACEFGENPDGTCMDACQFKQSINDTQSLHWSAYVYGEQVTGACFGDFGATRCEVERIPNDSTLCTDVDSGEFTQNTRCHGKFQFTGKQCDGGTLFWGKDGPDTPIIPDDPIHDPDDPTGDIEDPSVLPDDSTNTVNPPNTGDVPDVEDPDTDESTDKGVVNAIKGLNSDVNKALHALNVDLNQSSADIQNQIIALNASMVTNTQAIQKQQINDNKIYENTKALIQQANGDITTAVNRNTNSVGEVVKGLDDLQTTNADGFAELSDKLDDLKPCEPTEENNYCENPHGLGSDYVGDVLTQADKAVSGAMNSYEKTVTDAANDLIEKNLTAESEGHINAISDSFLSVLPKPTPCMNLSLPTLGGGRASISCEFSQKLKMIISILIYIYTIKTLVEILLTEVTPVPSNKPGSGRYY